MARKSEGGRATRLGDQIQRELADIVRQELKDPRVGLVTFTGVEVSPDLTHAKVFFTVIGSPEAVADTGEVLQRARGFLRSQLAHVLRTRITPELHFLYDESIARGDRLSRLIAEAVRSDEIQAE